MSDKFQTSCCYHVCIQNIQINDTLFITNSTKLHMRGYRDLMVTDPSQKLWC
jgi:hypothetical protein